MTASGRYPSKLVTLGLMPRCVSALCRGNRPSPQLHGNALRRQRYFGRPRCFDAGFRGVLSALAEDSSAKNRSGELALRVLNELDAERGNSPRSGFVLSG